MTSYSVEAEKPQGENKKQMGKDKGDTVNLHLITASEAELDRTHEAMAKTKDDAERSYNGAREVCFQ